MAGYEARRSAAIEQVIADALTSTMTGHEFAAALDKAGITIARADAADIAALDALRERCRHWTAHGAYR